MPLCDDLRYFRETGDSTFGGVMGGHAYLSPEQRQKEEARRDRNAAKAAASAAKWEQFAAAMVGDRDLNHGPTRGAFRNLLVRAMREAGDDTKYVRAHADRAIAALRQR